MDTRLVLGEHYFVRTHTKQYFLLHLVGTFCDNVFHACFLAKRDSHYTCFKITCHTNDHSIDVANTKARYDLRIGYIRTLANWQICRCIIHNFLFSIYCNNIHAILDKFSCYCSAVSSKSEDCVCFLYFHRILLYPILISSVGSEITF